MDVADIGVFGQDSAAELGEEWSDIAPAIRNHLNGGDPTAISFDPSGDQIVRLFAGYADEEVGAAPIRFEMRHDVGQQIGIVDVQVQGDALVRRLIVYVSSAGGDN